MKIVIKKEFDGNLYIGASENIPGIYVQAHQEKNISLHYKRALSLIKKICEDRSLPFPSGNESTLFDMRIRFDELSTEKLIKFFEHQKYHLEFIDEDSAILMNSSYPFNLVHLPRTNHLSPVLVSKIFGEENTIYVGSRELKYTTPVSTSA